MEDATLKKEIREYWDEGALNYDCHVNHGMKTYGERELWKEAFSVRLPDKPLDVLDVGCGTGAMGLVLSEMGHRVKGIDLSENMMSIGREKAKECGLSMTFEIGDAEQTQFEDNTFDVVVNRHLLWTLPHPEKALLDWKRVIKPGGFVIVIEGCWDNGTLSAKLRREMTYTLEKLFTPKLRKEKYHYIDSVEKALPNMGGVTQEKAKVYFSSAGLSNIYVHDLSKIQEYQKKELTWYRKISSSTNRYMISGIKSE